MIEQLGDFWRSQTSRLMLVYLSIIMAMSVIFSISIYIVSAEQMNRQLTDRVVVDDSGRTLPYDAINSYLESSISTAKDELILRLYILNLFVLVAGLGFSYLLARWTLDPIERNVAAQTRFVSDASHELRTPLTAIKTTNEVALRRKKLTLKEAKDVIRANLEDAQRLQRLSAMLLEIAADEMTLSLEPVAVVDLVKQVIRTSAEDARSRRVTVKSEVSDDLYVEADLSAAQQALGALLDNAIKYSPEDSSVKITANKRRSTVWIRVADRGPGIAKNEQKQIFERFYRTDQARRRVGAGGYGLGLEIAQNIARHHGGSIELTSTPGRGSTFSLVLPLAKS